MRRMRGLGSFGGEPPTSGLDSRSAADTAPHTDRGDVSGLTTPVQLTLFRGAGIL